MAIHLISVVGEDSMELVGIYGTGVIKAISVDCSEADAQIYAKRIARHNPGKEVIISSPNYKWVIPHVEDPVCLKFTGNGVIPHEI